MILRKKVLFVDDDPALLEIIQETMADMAGSWDMTFLGSARAGLEAFRETPFDVVVSDLWMPGMNGIEFLQAVQALYPGTIRFILSSSTDRGLAMELVERAHQFLSKPCNHAYLKTAVNRALNLGSQVNSEATKALVARIGQLPAVPALYQEINQLLASDRATLANLGRVIDQDPAMTAMVLKLVNSAFFNLRHTVSSPSEALPFLGIDLLKSLVLAHGLFSQVGSFGIPGFTIDHLWQHSLAVAGASRRIAEAEGVGSLRAADYFTAGILHDVGMLILASRFPDEYQRALATSLEQGSDLESAECHIFGGTHGEVGSYLLGLWGLPAPIVQAAAWHNHPRCQEAIGFAPAVAVHVANVFCVQPGAHEIFTRPTLDREYLAQAGLAHRLEAWREAALGGPGLIPAGARPQFNQAGRETEG
jgi:HD-like signal output (HDOD) protein